MLTCPFSSIFILYKGKRVNAFEQTNHFIHRFLKKALRLRTSSAKAFLGSLSPKASLIAGSLIYQSK